MRVRFLATLLVGVSLSGAVQAQDCPADLTRYTISMHAERLAHIRIDHTLASDWVNIAGFTANDGRTADSFISNATISGAHGSARLESVGNGAWSTQAATPGDAVVIEYDLALDHGDHAWPMGEEEIGFALGDGAFMIARSMLLADYGAPDCAIEVEFQADDSAAPWTVIGENVWRAADLDAFHNNALVFGNGFGRFVAETDEGNVTFIHDAESTGLAEQAAMDIAPSIAHTTAIFGDFPASNYHIFLFENDRPEGGAYNDSFAMLHPAPAQRVDAILWRQGFIHEINHLWLGHQIRPADGADIEWFKEGVADYLAIKTMWQLGYINTQTLQSKLSNLLRRHTMGVFMSQGQVALTEAGANKFENKMIIYGSGASWAFMLDVEMSATMGPGSFEAMLADLYANSDTPYTQERLMERINASSDGAAGRLLAQFDRGLMPTAFPAMTEPYGIEMAFMIPDMFWIDLNPRRCDTTDCLPAFIREAG
jgi:predicted metalloprotease with PDZ domain